METQPRTLSPWLTIWIRPRQTIRRIVDSDPEHQVMLLAMLGGIIQVLNQSSTRNAGDILSLPIILIICAMAGPIVGIILLYLMGALLRWTGSWLGGQASSVEVRAAFAWSSVPSIWSQILWLPKLALFGNDLFTSTMPRISANPFLALILLGFTMVELVVVMWAFVVLLKCLGEVQRFSAWRALATVFLSGLIVGVPVFCLLVLLSGLTITP